MPPRPPNVIAPRHNSDTNTPVSASSRYFIEASSQDVYSVRHRVDQRVYAECVPFGREGHEVGVVVALALERVAEVRIVRHQHHDALMIVEHGPHVRLCALTAALGRGTARAEPEIDRRNLRNALHVVERMEQ